MLSFCPLAGAKKKALSGFLFLLSVTLFSGPCHAGDGENGGQGVDAHAGVEGLGGTLGLVLSGGRGGVVVVAGWLDVDNGSTLGNLDYFLTIYFDFRQALAGIGDIACVVLRSDIALCQIRLIPDKIARGNIVVADGHCRVRAAKVVNMDGVDGHIGNGVVCNSESLPAGQLDSGAIFSTILFCAGQIADGVIVDGDNGIISAWMFMPRSQLVISLSTILKLAIVPCTKTA